MRLSRRLSAAAAAVTIAAVTIAIAGAMPSAFAASSASTHDSSGGPAWRGRPVRIEPVPPAARLAGAGSAWVVSYLSTSFNGGRAEVTGTITVPAGRPPRGGWPVVSFGHGFSGIADGCAPSRTGPSPWERAVQEALLRAGHAVAVTDYEGVGGPGQSPLIHGRAEAYGLIDIVRTARFIAPVSHRWAAVGYSLGGHAALFAASMAGDYGRNLRHVGTIALAPVTQFGLQLDSPFVRDPHAPVNPTIPFSGRTAMLTHPGYDAADWFTPAGMRLVDLAARICIDEMALATAGLTNGEVFTDPAGAADEFARLMVDQEIPVTRYDRGVRLVHGSADAIPHVLTEVTAAQLATAGTDVSYTLVPGADHFTLLPGLAPDVVTWVRELFAPARTAGPRS